MCGENLGVANRLAHRVGSPPRVRGKPAHSPRPAARRRITPACAGKTNRSKCIEHGRKDHPRVCGENNVELIDTGIMLGSPPRVRGKHSRGKHGARQERITPACAGKTLASRDMSETN